MQLLDANKGLLLIYTVQTIQKRARYLKATVKQRTPKP